MKTLSKNRNNRDRNKKSDKNQIKAFADAVEKSSANRYTHSVNVKATKVNSADALKKIMDKRKRHGC